MSDQPTQRLPGPPKGRWIRRSAWLVALAMLVLCGWFGQLAYRAYQQRLAVAEVARLGGEVSYDHQWEHGEWNTGAETPGPAWLREAVGDDFFVRVLIVELNDTGANDETLELLAPLASLHKLALAGTSITDEGLTHLHSQTELKQLDVSRTNVSALGVHDLQKSLPDLNIVHDTSDSAW